MDIDLGEELVFNVRLGDKVYKMSEPTVQRLEAYREKQSGNESMLPAIELLVDLGLPKQVGETMGVTKLTKLIEGITGALTEKK